VSARAAPFAPRLRAALLAGRRASVRGAGASSARRSEGYEFAQLRAYVEGDDPRRIDWAATARAGGLQTRVVLEDRALSLAAALDASASMLLGRTRRNYDLAWDAARVWYSIAVDDDRCARIGVDRLVLRDVRGRPGALACAQHRDEEGAAFGATLQLALATLSRGTRLLVVSDFLELDALLERVRACAARFDLTTLVASDPWRDDLPLGGFLRLRDAETGAVARAYVDRRARERYRAASVAREAKIVADLRRAGARVATLDERAGPERALANAFAIAAP